MITVAARLPHLAGTVLLTRALAVATAALLAVDGYVHFHDASLYDSGTGATITEGSLFRIEGGVAVAVALALLVRPRSIVWMVALVVASSAAGALYLYTYVDVGALGPLPDMYEPTWAIPGKRAAAGAEIAATGTAALGLVTAFVTGRRSARPAGDPQPGQFDDPHNDEGMSYADLPCGLRRRRAGDSRNLHRRRG